jgi:hypothetical protein
VGRSASPFTPLFLILIGAGWGFSQLKVTASG